MSERVAPLSKIGRVLLQTRRSISAPALRPAAVFPVTLLPSQVGQGVSSVTGEHGKATRG